MFEVRFYRDWVSRQDLVTFAVQVRQTDLTVRARRDLTRQTADLVETCREQIEAYACRTPGFLESLGPLPVPPDCPPIVREMLRAGQEYDVGPMAAVAGAIAEAVGRGLLPHSPEVIVENGGDIFLKMDRPARLGLYSGPDSPFSKRLQLHVDATEQPLGVCTSSGTVGHSLSLGKADAVVAVSRSAALADAAATAIANRVQGPDDVARALEEEQKRGTLDGLLIAVGRRIGAWGAIALASAES